MFLKQNKLVIKAEYKSFWVPFAFHYKIYDYHTGRLLLESFREFDQNLPRHEKGSIKELLSRIQHCCIKVLGPDKNELFTIKLNSPSKLFPHKIKYNVYDKDGMQMGYFAPNPFSWRAKYDVFEREGEKLFSVKFKAFIPKMLFEVNNVALARLYRRWKDVLKHWKNILKPTTFVLVMEDYPYMTESLKLLILASVICTQDMSYGRSEYL